MKTTSLSWEQVQELGSRLAARVEESGFAPEWLVDISVGGLVPLALLAEALGIRNVVTVAADSYSGTEQGELTVRYLPSVDLAGKRVLLVDEIAETGVTLERISGILKDRYVPAELKTAALAINQEKCRFLPDFHVFEDDAWIEFPWELPDIRGAA